jgi:hypothetical protein
MTLQLLHSKFHYKWGNFDFLFYQCRVKKESWRKEEKYAKQGVEIVE